ncbi:alpha/beta hydrolase [Phanerochaete sordida]|uniref:Alpha/beta hydrolase n=1 Tax=Phanerochaete sordida TaxID=48140 RepID=A0A9P3LIC8_9APHY|nr:alpha/beta hydrolase [Phanerochaete sordida]
MRTFSGNLIRTIVFALRLSGLASAKTLHSRDDMFDWTNLTASTNLTLSPCYDVFQCARLTVPLQYSNASAGEAQIALVVLPANVSRNDPAYLGPLLFNPGGPGGSGVEAVIENAALFQAVLGPNYDVVGFDPRGVGHSTPALAFFESPAEALAFFAPYPLNTNESVSSLGRIVASAHLLDDLASARGAIVAESVSTPAVARDMLAITRAFGREKLSYYGVSYGSVLGATFAAMFPDHVGRLAIDGVVNAHEWYQGNDFTKGSLTDTDAALEDIYTACVAAGPSACPIFETTPALVRARVNRLIESVHVAPVPIFNDSVTPPFAVADYTLVVSQLLGAVGTPYGGALQVAEAVVALENGDGAPMFAGSTQELLASLDTCSATDGPFAVGSIDVEAPIICGDSMVNTVKTLEEARQEFEGMLKMSDLATAWYPTTQGPCTGWKIRGKDRMNGSFETNTSFPLLLIGNTHDPVTPIANALNMSAGFFGSVVLQQNSTGHTSQSGFSACTALALNAYFNNGTLPAPGTVCQTEDEIFGGSASAALVTRGLNRRDAGWRPVSKRAGV